MFSCCSKPKPCDYYIEERNYDSEKILIDNNRLKLVYDGKIVVESGDFPESIKYARFFTIDARRFVVVILPREMIVLTQENLDEITKINGSYEELQGTLQKKYGYLKDEAEKEIQEFLDRNEWK